MEEVRVYEADLALYNASVSHAGSFACRPASCVLQRSENVVRNSNGLSGCIIVSKHPALASAVGNFVGTALRALSLKSF